MRGTQALSCARHKFLLTRGKMNELMLAVGIDSISRPNRELSIAFSVFIIYANVSTYLRTTQMLKSNKLLSKLRHLF